MIKVLLLVFGICYYVFLKLRKEYRDYIIRFFILLLEFLNGGEEMEGVIIRLLWLFL